MIVLRVRCCAVACACMCFDDVNVPLRCAPFIPVAVLLMLCCCAVLCRCIQYAAGDAVRRARVLFSTIKYCVGTLPESWYYN